MCDTVKLTVRYSFFDDPGGRNAFENLPAWLNRSYDFTLRGRDTKSTDQFDQFIFVNGVKTLINSYNSSAFGRETDTGEMGFHLTIAR